MGHPVWSEQLRPLDLGPPELRHLYRLFLDSDYLHGPDGCSRAGVPLAAHRRFGAGLAAAPQARRLAAKDAHEDLTDVAQLAFQRKDLGDSLRFQHSSQARWSRCRRSIVAHALILSYSSRRTTMGSRRTARRAGIQLAAAAMAQSRSATAT